MVKKKEVKKDKRGRYPGKDIFFVPVSEMDIVEGFNPRTKNDYGTPEEIEELVDFIITSADKLPAVTGYKKDGRYIITTGHRRRMCGILAQQKSKKEVFLWFKPEPKEYTILDRLTDVSVSQNGKDLTLLAQSEIVRRFLEEHNLSEKEIILRMHKSPQYVRNCKLLLRAPEDIKRLMVNNIVSETEIIRLFKLMPLDKAVEVIRETVENLSSRISPPTQLSLHSEEQTAESQVGEDVLSGRLLDFSKNEEVFHAPEVTNLEDETPHMQSKSQRGSAIITKKDFDTTLKKHNSVSIFKKMLAKLTEEPIKEEMADEFAFIQKIIEGNVDENEMYKRYFNGAVNKKLKPLEPGERDELFEDAAHLIVKNQMGSTSLIQRHLKLGYNRAGRIMDQLEKAGIVGDNLGVKDREVKFKTEEELNMHLENLRESGPDDAEATNTGPEGRDELFETIAMEVVKTQECNSAMLQGKFNLGRNRASRITEQLLGAGVVGDYDGDKKTREVKFKTGEELAVHLEHLVSLKKAEQTELAGTTDTTEE